MDILGIQDRGAYHEVFFLQNGKMAVHQAYGDSTLPYSRAELISALQANPSLGAFDPERYLVEEATAALQGNLEALITDMCRRLDSEVSPVVLEAGFNYRGVRIQADPVAQQNATGFLTAVAAGVSITFPVEWRTKANGSHMIQDLAELLEFAGIMLRFVQSVFKARWTLKDSLRAAPDALTANSLYIAGVEAMKALGGPA